MNPLLILNVAMALMEAVERGNSAVLRMRELRALGARPERNARDSVSTYGNQLLARSASCSRKPLAGLLAFLRSSSPRAATMGALGEFTPCGLLVGRTGPAAVGAAKCPGNQSAATSLC